ncbi:type II secretion system F family protein [Patescibacteria group bacterium]|nr:type II secretion system F family protein [Patescibacteria group bacterium]
MKFFYTATKGDGSVVKESITASNINEATRILLGQGLYVKKISKGRATSINKISIIGGVSLVDKILFAKHLATMLKSGITLSEGLKVIEEQTTSPRFKKIVANILAQTRTGQKLSTALRSYPRVFDTLVVNMISVGEESGTLEKNLEYLASDLEERHELKKSIMAASMYPAIVLIAVFGLLLLLAYFVLPKITQLFKTLKFELPLSTKILLFISEMFSNYGKIILAAAVLIPILIYLISRTKFIKPIWHTILLKIPILGKIIIEYNLSIICRTFAILLKSGITVDSSLIIITDTLKNQVYKKKLHISVKGIQTGKHFSDVLTSFKQSKRSPIFPLLAIKMINVGERSGQLEESLNYLAEYYEEEVNDTTKNLTTILEPLLLLFVGLLVGFVAISVITPIYQVTGRFGS